MLSPLARARTGASLAAVCLLACTAAAALAACTDIIEAGPDAGDASSDVPAADAGVLDAADAGPVIHDPVTCDPTQPYPDELGCTGLYSDWARGTLSPSVIEYKPAYELWADGAQKRRWIQIPPGKKIDVSDMNEWSFPVDTKFWKEFRLDVAGRQRRIETRLLWKIGDGQWVKATYRWNEAETQAVEVREGESNVYGTVYEIPSQSQCTTCHKGRRDSVLGFEGVLLANAGATGLTYEKLREDGLLTVSDVPAKPNLQIPGTPEEVAALGWTHVNCGVSCHSGAAIADGAQGRLTLRLDLSPVTRAMPAAVMETSIGANTVGVGLAQFVAPEGDLASGCRVVPGNPAQSALHYRTARRDPSPQLRTQMPPITSHQVDPQGTAAMAAWIAGMTVDGGYPAVPAEGGCAPP